MPTSNEIKQFIKRIPQEVKRLTYENVLEACNYYFPRLPIPIVDFTNAPFYFGQKEYSGWNLLYRGRKITNTENKPHPYVADISYIKDKDLDNIKNFGRANKKGESMFYGSLNFATACIETLSKGSDFKDCGSAMVSIGTWKFEKPLRLVQMPHSEKYWKLFYETVTFKSERLTEEHIKQHNHELRNRLTNDLDFEILELFGDAFARFEINDDSDYFLSNYYTDRVFNRVKGFYAPEEIDGIIYPSVPNSYQENNIVLKPSVVDTKLKFINAMQIWAVHFMKTSGGAQFNPIQQRASADETGKLSWR
jgi:hypothetical protein